MNKIRTLFKCEISARNILMNLLGSLILAWGLYNIHSISDITEGGVLGLTLLLKHWLDLSPSVTEFVLTAVCYVIGFKTFGKSFLVYSFVATAGFSLFYRIFEQFPPVYPPIAQMPLAASILGAVFVGIGAGLSVRYGGASSGDDALAMSLSHRFGFRISHVYLVSDLIVLILSLSYIEPMKLLYSLLTVILSGKIIDILVSIKAK